MHFFVAENHEDNGYFKYHKKIYAYICIYIYTNYNYVKQKIIMFNIFHNYSLSN